MRAGVLRAIRSRIGSRAMAQMESDSELTGKSSSSTLIAAELAAIGKKRVEECINAQTELLGRLQERNQQWLDRLQQEANLASEFASKLTAARSIPDAMTACQEWTSWWFEMMAEDGKHLSPIPNSLWRRARA